MIEKGPFSGTRVYLSAAIKGGAIDQQTFKKTADYITLNGGEVLSEHVGIADPIKREQAFLRKVGGKAREHYTTDEFAQLTRKTDADWVDRSSHLIAFVDTPSLGVGMEIERALLKHKMGLNLTPVLCLVRLEGSDRLSLMIRGVSAQDHPRFHVRTYQDIEEVRVNVYDLLTNAI